MSVEVISVPMGNDLCVVITGGERPHLGAVALAQARPSLEDASKLSASTSVLTLLGHKEDVIAREVAHSLAAKLNKNVVVCCGIHVDNVTPEELKFVGDSIEKFCHTYAPPVSPRIEIPANQKGKAGRVLVAGVSLHRVRRRLPARHTPSIRG